MKARDLALIGIYTALLIGGQLVFSWVAGIEIVTALLAVFCYTFGVRRSLVLVNAFLWLRCIIFGFFPTVVILYTVYYNLFAVVIAVIGKIQKHRITVFNIVIIVVTAALLTVLFTLLDDVITPLFYGYGVEAAKGYFIASLLPMGMQVLCSVVTVGLMFPLLGKILVKNYIHTGRDLLKKDKMR